jgi:hypothetical protein
MRVSKSVSFLAAIALVLTACGSGDTAAVSATQSPDSTQPGPAAWSPEELKYLNALSDADLAASIFLSATNYIEIGATVCNGLKQDILLDDLLSALASSGKQNGLNELQRTEFSLITSAAAVTYLCPDQKAKYKRDS